MRAKLQRRIALGVNFAGLAYQLHRSVESPGLRIVLAGRLNETRVSGDLLASGQAHIHDN